jgi:hypothetical protein
LEAVSVAIAGAVAVWDEHSERIVVILHKSPVNTILNKT